MADGVASYVWTTPWHPVNLRLGVLNRAAGPLYRRYGDLALGVEDVVAGAQRMIFDSGADLLLFSRFKRLSPRAAFVYRVSDDLRHSGVHPVVLEAEEAVAPDFDLISVPCRYIEERFRSLARVTLQHHGVDEALFDRYAKVADDLERKGFVVRKRHPRDRRAFLVWPTESGRTAKVEAVAILDEQQRCFLAPLTPAERQQLGALLKRLQRPPKRLPSC